MILDTPTARITLQPGQTARWRLRAGSRVRALRGTAWITADHDPRDIVLDPCDVWVADHDAQLVACALTADGVAEVQVDEPAGAGR